MPLVAPYPGFSKEARAIVRVYMEEIWPGATLDFGVSGWTVTALDQATERVRSYSVSAFAGALVGALLLGSYLQEWVALAGPLRRVPLTRRVHNLTMA